MNSDPALPSTAEVIGRYEVLEELGRGAMGVVLLAHDPMLGRRVALKYLRSDIKLEAEERELLMKRMHQEARAIARVVHPGIVALHDMGNDGKRGAFLVFEHARGPTLESVLERGRLTREGSARLARELGDALDAAHAHSVVHRDIKPGNIILTEEGSKIADFGVARLPDSTLTKAGARVGTPAYSSPEALGDGEHSDKSDQFSMAACLYEGLCGRRAYPGEDAIKVARSIQKDAPLPIARELGLSERVDRALLRAMARDPRERFTSCGEFGADLADALLGASLGPQILPRVPVLFEPHPKDTKRAIGTAVLWSLVGATIAAGAYQIAAARSRAAPAPVVEKAISARPAYLSPSAVKK